MMTSRERVLAMLDGRPVDHLPLMPITMMFAADQIGEKYGRYALDHRIMAEAQIRTAGEFGFDHVSAITETREAPDCGASVQYFDDQPYAMDESRARLAEKSVLKDLKMPEPRGGGAMHDRLLGLALMKERAGRDKGDYGLLKRAFHDQAVLLDRILDRLKVGQENLHILVWAADFHIPFKHVVEILEALDINSRRLIHRFDPLSC